MTDHLSIETSTGTATLASAGVTFTGDYTSTTYPLQADQPVTETFTVSSDGTFSTSNHPGVVSGVIVSNSKIVTVNNQNSACPPGPNARCRLQKHSSTGVLPSQGNFLPRTHFPRGTPLGIGMCGRNSPSFNFAKFAICRNAYRHLYPKSSLHMHNGASKY